jgi:hypothetical protein
MRRTRKNWKLTARESRKKTVLVKAVTKETVMRMKVMTLMKTLTSDY